MMFTRLYGNFRGCYGYGAGSFFGIGGFVMLAAIVILAVVAVIVVLRVLKKAGRTHLSAEALETLKLRYVKGEISEEEYLKVEKTLEK
ncbi:SHOCT domain-containing protein [Ethanoligenens sp.]|uniref:SHOCT domain-containing protein n=1 Tax=Ethanoligenens sp. TaxID=2099655 RepID=UPI0039E8461F